MAGAAPHLAQAQRAYLLGALDESERACRLALVQQREHPDALRLLGVIELRRNRPDEAAGFLAREIKARPGNADAHTLLAKARLGQDRPDEAIRLCDAALRLREGDWVALQTKAKSLVQLGQKPEAIVVLDKAVSEDAPRPALVALHAQLSCTEDSCESIAARLSATLDRQGVEPGDRLKLLYALGHAKHLAGNHAAAFTSWMRAKAVYPVFYDRAATAARTEAIIRFFSRERLESMPRATGSGERLCFIVGMPRTGSTLLERILDAHPQAVGIGESTWLPDLVGALPTTFGSRSGFPECLAGVSQAALTRIGRSTINKVTRVDRAASLIVDKNLANHRHVGLISLLFPGARVIHCLREPRDIALSCVMQNLSPMSHPYTCGLEDMAHAWVQCRRLMDHWLGLSESLGLRLDEVSYEGLVEAGETGSRELVESCGLAWDEACARFFETGRAARTLSMEQVREPIHRRAVGRWRAYEAELEPFERARVALLA